MQMGIPVEAVEQRSERIHKARLVAKGFGQIYGTDYTESFAPLAKLSSGRALLAVALHEKNQIHQMDVKTAFLNGNMEEEIFVEQPESIGAPTIQTISIV